MINVREVFYALSGKETICFRTFMKAEIYGNKTTKEYYLTVDTDKEICMIENDGFIPKFLDKMAF